MARAVRYTCAIATRRRRDCAKGVLAGEKIANTESVAMTYSYTQISQYLTCPRRYRHRYLDGWQEKDLRAAMLFGRAFEQALAALFRREDPVAVLFDQWSGCKNLGLIYSGND